MALNLAQAALEISALALIGDQRQRSFVAFRCFSQRPGAAQQISACGVQQVIIVQIAAGGQRIDEGRAHSLGRRPWRQPQPG